MGCPASADVMDQAQLISRLTAGEPFGGHVPERIDTHISVVFLTADRAYKLKRALKTAYLDYRELSDRKRGCAREIAINRRTAPEIYLRTVPVTQDAGGFLTLGGAGKPLEWLVEMTRFDPRSTLDVLAPSGAIGPSEFIALADQIAGLHRVAAVVEGSDFPDMLNRVIAANREELSNATEAVFDAAQIAALTQRHEELARSLARTFERRAASGYERECHGDLHLGNICLIDGQPIIFDAIEFNDTFNNIDTLYDLAFLLMDLAQRDLAAAASTVFNRYLFRTSEYDDLGVLPLYQSVRAAIRAHVTARSAGQQTEAADRDRLVDLAQSYMQIAEEFLTPVAPRVIAIGGYSGTGKTTIANRIAPLIGSAPGAVVLSSDLIRKRQFAVEPEDRLGARFYRTDITRKVYGELFDLTRKSVSEGCSVIVDATFMNAQDRTEMEKIAGALNTPLSGYWLTGDASLLGQRIANRPKGASDATTDILDQQLKRGPGDVDWKCVHATKSPDGAFNVVRDGILASDATT